jgi:CDGSH-type Zn-finger protein
MGSVASSCPGSAAAEYNSLRRHPCDTGICQTFGHEETGERNAAIKSARTVLAAGSGSQFAIGKTRNSQLCSVSGSHSKVYCDGALPPVKCDKSQSVYRTSLSRLIVCQTRTIHQRPARRARTRAPRPRDGSTNAFRFESNCGSLRLSTIPPSGGGSVAASR